MRHGYSSRSLILHLLFIMSSCGNGSKEMIRKPFKALADEPKNTQHTMEGHHVHMDPSVKVFFFLDDLMLGKTIPVYFPHRDPSSSPHFLPREEANSIPFSIEEFQKILHHFSFEQGSSQAKAIEDTLRECKSKPIKGETKFCATSLESMFDFAHRILGFDASLRILATTHVKKPDSKTTLFQNYTILEEPEEIRVDKMVACHTMPYPYGVLYCHSQESKSRVFMVSLGGEKGDRVEALGVCHMDTSHWGRNHVSFRVLGIEPGSSPVCHFFPADNLVLVPLVSLNDM